MGKQNNQNKHPYPGSSKQKQGKPAESAKSSEIKEEAKTRGSESGQPKQGSSNAIEWHNKKTDIFKLATHISTFKLAGKQIRPTSNNEVVTIGNRVNVFELAITPGTAIGTEDPFNKAMIDLFNKVRDRYTTTIPFQANDLGTVILAVANVISLIAAMDRVLNALSFVSYKSSLTPEILHAALVGDVNPATIKAGYDADVMNSPNLKLALEVQICRLEALFMPKMSLFDFAGWIYKHVYFEDEEGLRGDMSCFKPGYIVKWSPTVPVIGATGVYASGLEYKDINSYLSSPNPHDARIYLAAIKDCIDALVQDDNVRTICGWLHQYAPDSPKVSEIVMSVREFEPDRNAEMDLFVAGMTFVPQSNFTGTYVAQDVLNECLNFTLYPAAPAAPVTQWLVNYHKAPTDDEIGLSLIFTALSKDGYVYCDPFVAENQLIYRRDDSGTMVVTQTTRLFPVSTTTALDVLQTHEGLNPTSYFYTLNSGGAVSAASLFAECEYQVLITPENAYNVHYASLSSLFETPEMRR